MPHNSLKRQMLNPLARDILVEKAPMASRKDFAAVVMSIDEAPPK